MKPHISRKSLGIWCFATLMLWLSIANVMIFRERSTELFQVMQPNVFTGRGLSRHSHIAFYRIIGNEIPHRHAPGQTLRNLKTILDFESSHPWWEKEFVLNRLVNKTLERKVRQLLVDHNKTYTRITFKPPEYKKTRLDLSCIPHNDTFFSKEYLALPDFRRRKILYSVYRYRSIYVMNNNGARNVALRDGKQRAEWTLPWDGNCYLTRSSIETITRELSGTDAMYFTTPMARATTNASDPKIFESLSIVATEEPQVGFHRLSSMTFHEGFYYGHLPKVELLWRLKEPGPWDKWNAHRDGIRCPTVKHYEGNATKEVLRNVGWTLRLFSGFSDLEETSGRKRRATKRMYGILSYLFTIDSAMVGKTEIPLRFYNFSRLVEQRRQYKERVNGNIEKIVERLLSDADEALQRGPFSVLNKTSIPPSGDKRDYFHLAPYWWMVKEDGGEVLLKRYEGMRNPASILYSNASKAYDRSSLQHVFDDTLMCSLAWFFSGDIRYAQHGSELINIFFVRNETAMKPHLTYAQYIGRPSHYGIIEMKDLYFFVDAVRLLEYSGVFPDHEALEFKRWLGMYLKWLLNSDIGQEELCTQGNHGVYFDLQVAAISDYLGELDVLQESLVRAYSRLQMTFLDANSQSDHRSNHHSLFHMMGWIHIAQIAYWRNIDVWSYTRNDKYVLVEVVNSLLHKHQNGWNAHDVDDDRLAVLKCMVCNVVKPHSSFTVNPKLHPHAGVKPYWNLGLLSLEAKLPVC